MLPRPWCLLCCVASDKRDSSAVSAWSEERSRRVCEETHLVASRRCVCESGGHAMANGRVVTLDPARLEIRGRPRSLGERHHMSHRLSHPRLIAKLSHLFQVYLLFLFSLLTALLQPPIVNTGSHTTCAPSGMRHTGSSDARQCIGYEFVCDHLHASTTTIACQIQV